MQTCELCFSDDNCKQSIVPNTDLTLTICHSCEENTKDLANSGGYWRCLEGSIWGDSVAVKMYAHYILSQLEQDWALDLKANIDKGDFEQHYQKQTQTLDANNQPLSDGDSVTIIKDLDVKGTSFVAKRGTVVKNIHLTDNPEQLEGRVNGTKIVLLSKFVRKA